MIISNESKIDALPLEFICHEYHIGASLAAPTVVHGGYIHQMWHLQTTSGEYALKRINRENVDLLSHTIMPIIHAENFAQHLNNNGIAARVALKARDHSWFTICPDDYYWMVFPWIKGHIKSPEQVEEQHAQQVGKLLQQIHTCTLPIKKLHLPEWFGFSDAHWQTLINKATQQQLPWAEHALAHQAILSHWSHRARDVKNIFTSELIVSHRDLSVYNVIWNEQNQPTAIDWEYSGLVHPEFEIFNTAMIWSLQSSGKIKAEIFETLINATEQNLSLDHSTLLAGFAGYIIEWCEFNMQRSFIDPSSIQSTTSEIKNVIDILEAFYSIKV